MNFDFSDRFSEKEIKRLLPELSDCEINILREFSLEKLNESIFEIQGKLVVTALKIINQKQRKPKLHKMIFSMTEMEA